MLAVDLGLGASCPTIAVAAPLDGGRPVGFLDACGARLDNGLRTAAPRVPRGFIDSRIANGTVQSVFSRQSGLPLVALAPLAMQA